MSQPGFQTIIEKLRKASSLFAKFESIETAEKNSFNLQAEISTWNMFANVRMGEILFPPSFGVGEFIQHSEAWKKQPPDSESI